MKVLGVVCLALLGFANSQAQELRHDQLAAGTFLVAPRKALDPNFAQTVVLIVQYDDDTTLGLIINQPSRVAMGKLFPERKTNVEDPVYAGGPVGRSGMLALVRSSTKQAHTQFVFDDVYLLANRKLLTKTLASDADAKTFRVFLGYAGWSPGQLENELDNDLWHLFRADAKTVFDPHPENVWDRLIKRTEMQIARTHTRPILFRKPWLQ